MQVNQKQIFAELYGRHFREVYSYVAFRLTPDYETAADITQDVFLAAWEALERVQACQAPSGWLRTVARNKVADHLRRRIARPERAMDSVLSASAEIVAPPPSLRQERAQIVSAVMRKLPARYAQILEEKYLDGLSVSQIASLHGRREKAVEALLWRARQAFGKVLTQSGQFREVQL